MRVTKKILESRLESAINHQRQPIVAVSSRSALGLRDEAGFTECCCYGYGVIPVTGEVGTLKGIRYRLKSRKGDK